MVDSSVTNELTLVQEFVVNVAIDSVWNAYTTKEGWESWAAAKAEVDFQLGGAIKTSYDKNATIGDSSTITLNIINYVPKKLLTLQAELSPHFPEFMKKDSEHFYNVITFEKIDLERTKIVSYGIGYQNNDKYKSLLSFFIKGNEMSYLNLISYLETGKKTNKY